MNYKGKTWSEISAHRLKLALNRRARKGPPTHEEMKKLLKKLFTDLGCFDCNADQWTARVDWVDLHARQKEIRDLLGINKNVPSDFSRPGEEK